MKKTLLILIVIFTISLMANAQNLPVKVKSYLNKNYPKWKANTEPNQMVCNGKTILTSDFDSNRKTDYAAVIRRGGKLYYFAFLAVDNNYKAYLLTTAKVFDEDAPRVIVIEKKGTEFPFSILAGAKSVRLKNDAVGIGCGWYGDGQGVYYFEKGKFQSVGYLD